MDRLPKEERRRILKEREELRKKLKAESGITNPKELRQIYKYMGLELYEDERGIMPFFRKLNSKLAKVKYSTLLLLLIAMMGAIFAYSSLMNQKGNFVISLSNDLVDYGFELSDTDDFKTVKAVKKSEILLEVNPYTILDMPSGLDEHMGSHNFNNVLAYTFWIRNNGEETRHIDWHLILNKSTKNVSSAVWVMIFKDGDLEIYAKEDSDGTRADISGISESWPYIDLIRDKYYLTETGNGRYKLEAKEYETDRLLASEYNQEETVGEKHKFTVVIWVEGSDVDCTQSIMGGHAGYELKFVENGDDDYLSDLDYRSKIDERVDGLYESFISKIFSKFK